MKASFHCHVEIVRDLLAAGADKRAESNVGNTARALAGRDIRCLLDEA